VKLILKYRSTGWIKSNVFVKMGFDGIDFRLQNHSGMVTDYVNYGYNEPIIKRYKEKYGVDILKAEAEPLKIMEIRGEYFPCRFLKRQQM